MVHNECFNSKIYIIVKVTNKVCKQNIHFYDFYDLTYIKIILF